MCHRLQGKSKSKMPRAPLRKPRNGISLCWVQCYPSVMLQTKCHRKRLDLWLSEAGGGGSGDRMKVIKRYNLPVINSTRVVTCCCCCLLADLSPTLLWPHGLQPARLLCPWVFQVRVLEWVAISSFRGSSQTRGRSRTSYTSCIARRILYC